MENQPLLQLQYNDNHCHLESHINTANRPVDGAPQRMPPKVPEMKGEGRDYLSVWLNNIL